MLPPAPPLLSITNVWLKVRLNRSQISRLTESVPPPGANGTMNRTGLAGHAVCARATKGAARARLPSIK